MKTLHRSMLVGILTLVSSLAVSACVKEATAKAEKADNGKKADEGKRPDGRKKAAPSKKPAKKVVSKKRPSHGGTKGGQDD